MKSFIIDILLKLAALYALILSLFFVSICISLFLLFSTLFTTFVGLSIAGAIGYGAPGSVIDQYEFQRRFDLTTLPQISKQDFDTLASLNDSPGFVVRDYGTGSLCVKRDFDPSVFVCAIKVGQKHYFYTFPMPFHFPCKNPVGWLYDGCGSKNYGQHFDHQEARPSRQPEGWYYSPEYGLERVIENPEARPLPAPPEPQPETPSRAEPAANNLHGGSSASARKGHRQQKKPPPVAGRRLLSL